MKKHVLCFVLAAVMTLLPSIPALADAAAPEPAPEVTEAPLPPTDEGGVSPQSGETEGEITAAPEPAETPEVTEAPLPPSEEGGGSPQSGEPEGEITVAPEAIETPFVPEPALTEAPADAPAPASWDQCGDDVYWRIESNTLYITGQGDMWDYVGYGMGMAPWADVRQFRAIVISEGVTGIGEACFYDCESVTSVSIPGTVTRIGRDAFARTGLTEVTLSASVAYVGTSAFGGCLDLCDITVLNPGCEIDETFNTLGMSQVTAIHGYAGSTAEEYAWQNGHRFLSLDCGDNVFWHIDGDTLYITGQGDMWDYVGYGMGMAPWADVRQFTAIVISEGVTGIGEACFYDCPYVTKVSIPGTVTYIGGDAFARTALTEITLSASVAYVGAGAFSGCTDLRTVTVLNPLCEIDEADYTLGMSQVITIRGYDGSTAEAYAGEKGIRFESLGPGPFDVFKDGRLDIKDARALLDMVIQGTPLPDASYDLHGDGKLDLKDVTRFYQMITA